MRNQIKSILKPRRHNESTPHNKPSLRNKFTHTLISGGVIAGFVFAPLIADTAMPETRGLLFPAAHASVDDQAGTPGSANYNAGKFVATRRHVDSPKVYANEKGELSLQNEVGEEELRPIEDTVNWVGKGYNKYNGKNQYQLTVPQKTGLEFVGPAGTVVYEAPAVPLGNHDPIWAGFGADTSLEEQHYRDETISLDLMKVNGPGQVQLFSATDDDPEGDLGFTWMTVQRLLSSTDPGWNTTRLNPGTHTHNRTTFTRPGRYELTYRATARKADGTLISSPSQTTVWQVGGIRPRNDQSMPAGWDKANWIADPKVRYQQHANKTPDSTYTFTLDDYRENEYDGDQNLTSMKFEAADHALNGVATVWINGYYLTDLDVVDGELSVSPSGDHTGYKTDTWNELLGSAESTLQVSFVPSNAETGAWISEPFTYRHGQGQKIVTSTQSSATFMEPQNDPGNIEFKPGIHQPSSLKYTATVKPGSAPGTYLAEVCAEDHDLQFFVRGGFYEAPEDSAPSTDIKGNSVKATGCWRYQDDGVEWNDVEGKYPKFTLYPHPEVSAEAVTVSFGEPYNLKDPLTKNGEFKAAPEAEANSGANEDSSGDATPSEPKPAQPGTDTPKPAQPGANQPSTQQKRLVITNGHVDIVASLDAGATSLKLRDDTHTASDDAVMRELDDVIFAVGNNALSKRPEHSGPAFDVLGPKGQKFFWLPQAQQEGIIWPGYNTEKIDYSQLKDGLKLTMKVLRAPENARIALLRSKNLEGGFDTLADTAQKDFQVETDLAAHAHLAWLFSQPGLYEIQFSYEGTLKNGTQLKASSAVAHFAMGNKAVTQVAEGVWPSEKPNDSASDEAPAPGPAPEPAPKPTPTPKPAPKPAPAPHVLYKAVAPAPHGAVSKDVPAKSMFAGEIQWMLKNKYSTGWNDGTYRPLGSVNRDAMAAFLYRLAGSPAVNLNGANFKDVPRNSLFVKEIAWMKQSGISTGWDDNTFRPLEPVSREAMAAFLYRFCKQMPDKCATAVNPNVLKVPADSGFKDVPVSHQFAKPIGWLAAAEVSTGWSDWTFRPGEPIHRDAMAAFLYRLKNNYLEEVK